MRPNIKKPLKVVGIFLGILILLAAGLGLYLYTLLPKFDSVPIVLQKELFSKPQTPYPMEGKYIYKSASELSSMIFSGEATSLEVLTEYLNNIKNNNYKYNALIYLREGEALAEAKAADVAISSGDTVGKPLLGLPITIKEMFWVKGSPSTLNSKMYGFIAPRNALIVDQLKQAGAIILGTTNVPYMLADYQTTGELYPTASNPYDTTRTPGGSTGGGAASVAAGFSALELGSDMGGSIREPAVFCGLWSLKPSFGALNLTDGTSPDSAFVYTRIAMASPGPLARSADDLQLIWDVLKKTKPDEKFQKPINWKGSSDRPLELYKMAWMDEWESGHGKVVIGDEVKEQLGIFIDSLKNHKVTLEKKAPPIYTELMRNFLASFASMMAEKQPWLIRKFIELDFRKTDDGSGDFKSFSDAIMDGTDTNWEKIQAERNVLIQKWETFFQSHDFFICPVTYGPAFKKGESWKPVKTDDGVVIDYMGYNAYTSIINATGHPAITVPLGLNKKGLPIGIQIIGPMYSDHELLHLAKLIQGLTPGYQKPM